MGRRRRKRRNPASALLAGDIVRAVESVPPWVPPLAAALFAYMQWKAAKALLLAPAQDAPVVEAAKALLREGADSE